MSKLTEPTPLWPEAPRYCEVRSLPPYRFVPGLNAHPTGQAEGHSFGTPKEALIHLPPERWKENQPYLFGVDLYHQGYFWEAHEAWEDIWHLTSKTGLEGQYLQGLIQNAAAQLKRHLHNRTGTAHLSREAYRRLSFVFDQLSLATTSEFMGLDIASFLDRMQRHYGPLWIGTGDIDSDPPLMKLRIG